MTRFLQYSVFCSIALCAVACIGGGDPSTGTHIGNPGQVQLVARSALRAAPSAPEGSLTSKDSGSREVVIHEVRANAGRIELDLPIGVGCAEIDEQDYRGIVCEQDERISVTGGPFVLELVSGTSTPGLEGVEIPPLSYRRVDVRLEDADQLPASDPLHGKSLALKLSSEALGIDEPFWMLFDFNEDARVESGEGVAVSSGDTLLVALDAAKWFEGIDLASCLQDSEFALTNGRLDLDDAPTACQDLAEPIKQRIKESGQLDKIVR